MITNELRDSILAEYEVSAEEIDFEISEDMTEEQFRAALDEYVCKKKKCAEDGCSEPDNKKEGEDGCEGCEGEGRGDDEGDAEKKKCELEGEEPEAAESTFAFTYREKAEAIAKAMPNSERVWHYVCDFDDKYAYVERCIYGDNGCEDARGRFEYAYDEKEKEASIVGEFEEMVVRWLTKEEDAQIDAIRIAHEELMSYKETRERQDKEFAYDSALAEFADIADNEEYKTVFEKRYEYASVEDLKNACYIIKGKMATSAHAHKAYQAASVPVTNSVKIQKTLREKLHEEYKNN